MDGFAYDDELVEASWQLGPSEEDELEASVAAVPVDGYLQPLNLDTARMDVSEAVARVKEMIVDHVEWYDDYSRAEKVLAKCRAALKAEQEAVEADDQDALDADMADFDERIAAAEEQGDADLVLQLQYQQGGRLSAFGDRDGTNARTAQLTKRIERVNAILAKIKAKQPHPHNYVIKVTPGAGKTSEFERLLAEEVGTLMGDRKLLYVAPTLQKDDEFLDSIVERSGSMGNLRKSIMGVLTERYRSPSSPAEDQTQLPTIDDGEVFDGRYLRHRDTGHVYALSGETVIRKSCLNIAIAERFAGAGVSVGTLCQQCPFAERCERQQANRKLSGLRSDYNRFRADIAVAGMAHASLAHPKPSSINEVAVMLIDEDPSASAFNGDPDREVCIDHLSYFEQGGPDLDGPYTPESVWDRIATSIEAVQRDALDRCRVKAKEAAVEALGEVAQQADVDTLAASKAAAAMRLTYPVTRSAFQWILDEGGWASVVEAISWHEAKITACYREDEADEDDDGYADSGGDIVERLLRWLPAISGHRRCIDILVAVLNFLRDGFEQSGRVLIKKGELHIFSAQKIHESNLSGRLVITLTATPPAAAILEAFTTRRTVKLADISVDAAPGKKSIAITGLPTSSKAVGKGRPEKPVESDLVDPSVEYRTTHQTKHAGILRALVNVLAEEGGSTSLIAKKDILYTVGAVDGVLMSNFTASLGLNNMAHTANHIVLGSEYPGEEVLRHSASVMTGEWIERELAMPVERTGLIHRKGGDPFEIKVKEFDHPLVMDFYKQAVVAPVEQALHRSRLVQPSDEPCRVICASPVALPWVFDEVLAWEDIEPEVIFASVMSRHGVVDNARLMREVYPDLFSSEKRAGVWLLKVRDELGFSILSESPHNRVSNNNLPSYLITRKYQPSDRIAQRGVLVGGTTPTKVAFSKDADLDQVLAAFGASLPVGEVTNKVASQMIAEGCIVESRGEIIKRFGCSKQVAITAGQGGIPEGWKKVSFRVGVAKAGRPSICHAPSAEMAWHVLATVWGLDVNSVKLVTGAG